MTSRKFILTLLFVLFPLVGITAANTDDNTYETPQRLFHIARSANRNLVCYDVNLKNGKLDVDDPIKVYWVNREEKPGVTNGLSYIQRKFAYGYKVESSTSNSCICTLTAYSQRQLTIKKVSSQYVCLIEINHQPAILRSLYVKAHPHNPLKVEYVELEGESLSTHQTLREKVINK